MTPSAIDAYPLQWPEGWKRTTWPAQAKFKATFGRARDDLLNEVYAAAEKELT